MIRERSGCRPFQERRFWRMPSTAASWGSWSAGQPRLGSRATRTRKGLDEILAPAGFVPVSWEPIVIEWSGTPEQIWQSNLSMFYDVVVLDTDQLAQLCQTFLTESSSLLVDGRLPCGMRINIATARLANSEEASGVPPGSGIVA